VKLIRWTAEASDQLEAAVRRILQDNPSAARNVAQAVIDRIEQLATFPGLGRPGEVKGTRELVTPPYVVVYRSTEEIVEILHIWHGAQDWR
jgi:plasmid stabilization system protein ParE